VSGSRLKIVVAIGSAAAYLEGGGHWAWAVEHLLGLEALGHDVFWLEAVGSTGDRSRDQQRVAGFFERVKAFGFHDRCGLLVFDSALSRDDWTLEAGEAHGFSCERIREIARSADMVWNVCGGLRRPLLALFRRRVLVDYDPGILQVSALNIDLSLHDHDVFFSVGSKLDDEDCEVPRLGLSWHPFKPFVYLPRWPARPAPDRSAPFTSVVHWTWQEIWLQSRVLSTTKRDAYLRYVDLPRKAGRPFELASMIYPDDGTGDRDMLLSRGWSLVDPRDVAGSPDAYRGYIAASRAELACPKPIYRELKTGWMSDRSARYLASGRPVLAEDTGFSEHIPTGTGLVAFRNAEEALNGVADIDGDYERHRRGARALAEEFLDSDRVLRQMLSLC
jgi:hypothetical protein